VSPVNPVADPAAGDPKVKIPRGKGRFPHDSPAMSRPPPLPTSLRLNSRGPHPSAKQTQLSLRLFSPPPILCYTVGKFAQLPEAQGPEVVILGRSNVGVHARPPQQRIFECVLMKEILVVECPLS